VYSQTVFRGLVMVEALGYLRNREWCGCKQAIHSEVEVAGDEVFRTPHWSAGVPAPALQCRMRGL
jgi:hypothetical protein